MTFPSCQISDPAYYDDDSESGAFSKKKQLYRIIFNESKALKCIKINTCLKKNAPWNDSSKNELGTPGEQLQAKRR